MKSLLYPTTLSLIALLGLAGCSSPATGQLIVSDDDDAVGDDDDSVGDDDDSVGDDDDSVGDDDDDDDDGASNPWEGEWNGEISLSRAGGKGGGGFTICAEDAEFDVTDTGAMSGEVECSFGRGGGGTVAVSGELNEGGELLGGIAHMDFGDFLDEEYEMWGGIFEEEGKRYLYMSWEAELQGGGGGGGGSFDIVGEGWGLRN